MEMIQPIGVLKRIIHLIIDLSIIGILVVALQKTIYIGPFLSSALTSFTYYFVFEGIFRQTFGKFITNTTVISSDGNPPSFKQILIRTISRFIPFDLFTFFKARPVGLHDELSSTIVVTNKVKDSLLEEHESLIDSELENQSHLEKIQTLNILILNQKKSFLGKDHKNEIIHVLDLLIHSKEDIFILISVFKDETGKDLIKELKSLSKNYSIMKTYLSLFIDYGYVKKEYPHELIV